MPTNRLSFARTGNREMDRLLDDMVHIFDLQLGDGSAPAPVKGFRGEALVTGRRVSHIVSLEVGVSKYELYRSPSPDFREARLLASQLQPSIITPDMRLEWFDSMEPGTFYYWVRAVKGNRSPQIQGRLSPPVEVYWAGVGSVLEREDSSMLMTLTGTHNITGTRLFTNSVGFSKQVYFESEIEDVIDSGTLTIDWRLGNNHRVTWDADCAVTMIAPAGVAHLTLRGICDGTLRAVTWNAVNWGTQGDPAAQMSTTVDNWDIFMFIWHPAVSTYSGSYHPGHAAA